MPNIEHAVIVVGGGPTGMMLAAELKLAGVDVAILERRSNRELVGSRAGGLHARTLEIFDQRGIADRFLAEGQKAQTAGFAGVHFDLSGFPTRFPHGLGLWQMHTERILGSWVDELGVPTYFGADVADLGQDYTCVDAMLSDGRSVRAGHLVGCDGGRSLVRKAAGIAFPGSDPTVSNIIAQVEMTGSPPLGVHRTAFGLHSFGRLQYEIVDGKIVYADEGPYGVMVTEQQVGATTDPTLDDLREALTAVCGTDYGVHSPTVISRFTDAARLAETYRKGRVLVAGDAAHIHPPDGGQGMQLGVQDAVNLGWKLAQVVKGTSPHELLDTYHAERHPIAACVLRTTMASVALRKEDDRTAALREIVADLLGMNEPKRNFAGMLSGLSIHYDLGPGHPLLGRRMPDLNISIGNGAAPVYSLLHHAQPLLLNFAKWNSIAMGGWLDRVRLVQATCDDGDWELPVVGTVSAPTAVLVRPDGYVAWVGEGNDAGLSEALTMWFGQPAAR
jgi:2-polyprenyl-6-methoxyphenol hydroxylase-like FAD-dependent oxidoreductase